MSVVKVVSSQFHLPLAPFSYPASFFNLFQPLSTLFQLRLSLSLLAIMKAIEPDYEKILNFYRITSSPLRIEILKAIFDSHVEFTCKQITDKMNSRKATIKPGTITRVVRLYTMRGLLNQTLNKKSKKQGRPAAHYVLSGSHIL